MCRRIVNKWPRVPDIFSSLFLVSRNSNPPLRRERKSPVVKKNHHSLLAQCRRPVRTTFSPVHLTLPHIIIRPPGPKFILLFKPTDRLCFKSLNLCLASECQKSFSSALIALLSFKRRRYKGDQPLPTGRRRVFKTRTRLLLVPTIFMISVFSKPKMQTQKKISKRSFVLARKEVLPWNGQRLSRKVDKTNIRLRFLHFTYTTCRTPKLGTK